MTREAASKGRPDAHAGEGGIAGAEAGEEPNTTGTLFIMILFLVALVGMWALVYLILLER